MDRPMYTLYHLYTMSSVCDRVMLFIGCPPHHDNRPPELNVNKHLKLRTH